MILKVYSIRDDKAGTFAAPFYQANHQVAQRSLNQAALDPNTTIHKFPSDFALYCVGEFDDANGKITPLDQPEFVSYAQRQPELGLVNDE